MTDLDKATESLEKARKYMDELPNPSEDLSVAVKQAEKALEALNKAKHSIEDLTEDIISQRTSHKIEKLAQRFEIKSQERATCRTISQK